MYPKFSSIFKSQANKAIICVAVRGLVDTQNVPELSEEEIQHAVDLQIKDTEYEKTKILTSADILADYNLMAASRAVKDINESKSKITAEHVREIQALEGETERVEIRRSELHVKDRGIQQEDAQSAEKKYLKEKLEGKKLTPRNLLKI